jgi:hypothetical protein
VGVARFVGDFIVRLSPSLYLAAKTVLEVQPHYLPLLPVEIIQSVAPPNEMVI